jgi:hypothetical protein
MYLSKHYKPSNVNYNQATFNENECPKILAVLVSVVLISSVAGGVYVSSLGKPQAGVENEAISAPSSSPIPQAIEGGTIYANNSQIILGENNTIINSEDSSVPPSTPLPTPAPSPTHRPYDFNIFYDVMATNTSTITIAMNFAAFYFSTPITEDISISSFTVCINNTIFPTSEYCSISSIPKADLISLNGTYRIPNELTNVRVTYTFNVDVSKAYFGTYSAPILSYNGPYNTMIVPAIL